MPLDFAKLRDPAWLAEQKKKRDEEAARQAAHHKQLWAAMHWCDEPEHYDSLSESERGLVRSVKGSLSCDRLVTPAQEKWLFDIAKRLGFKLAPAAQEADHGVQEA